MAIGDQIFPVFDAAGAPLALLTPTWVTYLNALTGASVAGPAITEVGGGLYKFSPSVPADGHQAGIIDCGATASTRYLSWEGRYADLQVADLVARLHAVSEGRWKIFTDGVNKDTLILYGPDGVTAIQQWDLKDALGSPTSGSIFERVPRIGV
jgi:hypothetical protein